jgi:rieske iron-sulfur protein
MKRRRLLTGLCVLGIGAPRVGATQTDAAAVEPDPPQENDWLVFAYGERAGQRIAPGDLDVGARQVFAFPMDPAGDVARGGRLNQIVVVKLDPGWLSEETRARSADGVVAYSGVCTHAGCDIDIWVEGQRRLQCMCHESQFDPADGATVVGGPALSPLAALPLKLVDGHLAVAAMFVGRVGFQQTGLSLNPFGL